MKNNLWIDNSKRIYAWLLHLYPKEYRSEYGSEMVRVFTDQCRSTSGQHASFGLFALWARTLIDLVKTATYENLTSPNAKFGLLEAVPNIPLPWKGVALVLIPGLLFFISQIGQLMGTNWFYLVVYRSSYFMMIPVLLVWWRAGKFPLWGLIPLGLFFNNILDVGYRLQLRMINPDLPIWKVVLPIIKNLNGTRNLFIGIVFLIFISLSGLVYTRKHRISRMSLVLLAIYVLVGISQIGLSSYIHITGEYHVWNWTSSFSRTELYMLSPLWLQDIYLSAGFLLLISFSTFLASKHGNLAILFPLGYLLASILYGGYQPIFPDERIYTIIATVIIIYRLLIAIVTPIWIVRSLNDHKRKWAIAIPIGVALIFQTGIYFIILFIDKTNSLQVTTALSSFIETVLIGIGLGLAISLYRPLNLKIHFEKGDINPIV